MKTLARFMAPKRLIVVALLLAISLTFLVPGISQAHAILLRSDPSRDAVLDSAPTQVKLWFSEELNPTFSTAAVTTTQNQRVDKQDAHITPGNAFEMDLSLSSTMGPGVYIVVWRSDSNDDGHVLRGSFIFTVKRADGSIPTASGTTLPSQDILGGGNTSGLYTGQIDGPGLFNLIMITLVELGAVFWVGAQLWRFFVIQAAKEHDTEEDPEQQVILKEAPKRFERVFSLPALLVLLLANVGVLVGQALSITNGQWSAALGPALLASLVTSGRFGNFWLMREIVTLLAIAVALFQVLVKQRTAFVEQALGVLNLILGLALFIAIAMSSHASAVSSDYFVYAILIDWLHLLGAALWIGGMFSITTSYLPVLATRKLAERARSLLSVLAYFSPWAIVGVLLLSATGPFSATLHLNSFGQLLSTTYGRVLSIKILLVGALLGTSAYHVGLLRPRMSREYKKYAYAVERQQRDDAPPADSYAAKLLTQQLKLREGRLNGRIQRLTTVLRWEPLLGVAVLLCVGLMNIFAGTLSPISAAPVATTTSPTTPPKPFVGTVRTTDGAFMAKLTISPNRFGTNVFTVDLTNAKTGKAVTEAGVALYATMLDMDMGTDPANNLQPNSHGGFSARGDLSMSGNWEIRIQIRTPDNKLHEARIKFFTPF